MPSLIERTLFFSIFIIFLNISTPASATQKPKFPFPQHVNYAKDTIIPNNYSRESMDIHVREFYDYWKTEYIVEAGQSIEGIQLYRVAFGRKGTKNYTFTVSEGQGSGMIISVIMAGYDKQANNLFDGLWLFSRKHPSDTDTRLMTWRVPKGAAGNNSAFDGDADIAYALLLAHKQWGSDGQINYQDEAKKLINAIYESTIGPNSQLPMLGDWVESDGNKFNLILVTLFAFHFNYPADGLI